MNIKLEIAGEKYEIETVFYGVDANELPNVGYEVFGFNPDGSAVLLGDNADSTYSDFEEAAKAAFNWLIWMIADAKEERESTSE